MIGKLGERNTLREISEIRTEEALAGVDSGFSALVLPTGFLRPYRGWKILEARASRSVVDSQVIHDLLP
jgi:hypothetical protein